MFYSIVNKGKKSLLLVDGGSGLNAERVRRVIDENGGAVEAWFLTHYHEDHIGAFNELWEQYKDQIGMVYVTPFDWDTFVEVQHDWDTPEAFSRFLEQTKDSANIKELFRGTELSIQNIRIKNFNAFDDIVRQYSTDWPNDCSLVLKFSFQKDSVLFLGDLSRAGIKLGEYLLNTYGAEELHADYVQGGHHGNWRMPISFYEAIHPKEFFFDGPEWLMTGEQYDAKDTEAWCKEKGIGTHDYRNAPVSFVLD